MNKTVKMDLPLKKKAERFIKRKENKYLYPNLKAFVDYAVWKLLTESGAK